MLILNLVCMQGSYLCTTHILIRIIAGVNIAGFSFGCNTTVQKPYLVVKKLTYTILQQGFCDLSEIIPPVAALGGPDG